MKAICINNQNVDITIGKYYDIILHVGYLKNEFCDLIDDGGRSVQLGKYRFKTIEEIREEKLNELGI
jgi:hypothetical protein